MKRERKKDWLYSLLKENETDAYIQRERYKTKIEYTHCWVFRLLAVGGRGSVAGGWRGRSVGVGGVVGWAAVTQNADRQAGQGNDLRGGAREHEATHPPRPSLGAACS